MILNAFDFAATCTLALNSQAHSLNPATRSTIVLRPGSALFFDSELYICYILRPQSAPKAWPVVSLVVTDDGAAGAK
jgi:D-serine deaminase-like pyridoxal phosphate-dependent protein